MFRARNSFLQLFSAFALSALVMAASGQTTPRTSRKPGGRGSGIKSAMVPFPQLTKVLKFKWVPLDKGQFIEMVSEVATLPKGFGGKLKAEQQVVMLTYGYKKGGVARVYETPAIAGETPDAFTKLMANSGIFHDQNRSPDYQVSGITVDGVFLTPTSKDKGVIPASLASLKAGKK